MVTENVTNKMLFYSLRRQNNEAIRILDLPENSVIDNAAFITNNLLITIRQYTDFEIMGKYSIVFGLSKRMDYEYSEDNLLSSAVEKLYKTIKLFNEPENFRLDIFYCTSLIATDKKRRLFTYCKEKYNKDFNGKIAILNIEVHMGNVIIAIEMDGEQHFLLFTGEEFLALYEQDKTEEYIES